MGIWLATKTVEAIDQALSADGGNTYRRNLGAVLPHITDAYRDDEDGYRTHLGASVIGGKCARAVWYGYRWAHKTLARGRKGEQPVNANARMLRLWNRGHLEEGRFVSLLLMIGVQVYQQDANGKQFRLTALGGHFSGSGDGFGIGVPDLPWGVPCLLECKTHGDKSFQELKEKGVKEAKFEHYVQMQIYMRHFGVQYALYLAVNKNDDELHAEIVMYDGVTDEKYMERARQIIFEGDKAPARLRNASPGYHVCKYMCDHKDVCFSTVPVDRNCRTCGHVAFWKDGTVRCLLKEIFPGTVNQPLSKQQQQAGCDSYRVMEAMKQC
jgi:hypothetical protein